MSYDGTVFPGRLPRTNPAPPPTRPRLILFCSLAPSGSVPKPVAPDPGPRPGLARPCYMLASRDTGGRVIVLPTCGRRGAGQGGGEAGARRGWSVSQPCTAITEETMISRATPSQTLPGTTKSTYSARLCVIKQVGENARRAPQLGLALRRGACQPIAGCITVVCLGENCIKCQEKNG